MCKAFLNQIFHLGQRNFFGATLFTIGHKGPLWGKSLPHVFPGEKFGVPPKNFLERGRSSYLTPGLKEF